MFGDGEHELGYWRRKKIHRGANGSWWREIRWFEFWVVVDGEESN